MRGSWGGDRLAGDAGEDDISGGHGDDLMDGGAGSDTLAGDFGDDILIGRAGQDELHGNRGDDVLAVVDHDQHVPLDEPTDQVGCDITLCRGHQSDSARHRERHRPVERHPTQLHEPRTVPVALRQR